MLKNIWWLVPEAAHFQKFSEQGPVGNRRVAQTRQQSMRELESARVVSGRRDEATDVKGLSSVGTETL
jgi:hypothetical protein